MADADLFTQLLTRYQKAQKSGPLTDLMSMFGGPETQGDVMREAQRALPMLKLQQDQRSQRALELKEEAETRKIQTEQQKQTLAVFQALHQQIKDFHALPEDVQAAQRPARIKEFKLFGKVLGNAYDDTDAEAFFTTPGYADKMMATVDPYMVDADRTALHAQVRAEKDPTKRQALMDNALKATEQKAVADVQRQFQQIIPQRFAGRKDIKRSELRALANELYPELAKASPVARRAFEAVLADDKLMSDYGVISRESELEGQKTAAREREKGPEVLARTSEELARSGLTPKTATPGQIGKASDVAYEKEQVIFARRGAEAEKEKRKLPITPEERASLISIKALTETGEMVQPQAGITGEQANADKDLVSISPKQKERVTQLKPARIQLDGIQQMSRQLITATSPIEAATQGVALYRDALTGRNPVAKTYREAGEAFLGTLAKAFGGESGVLTNVDIQRVKGAVIATFFDTKDSRDLKHALVNDIYQASHSALVAEITGQSSKEARSRLKTLLDRLQKENAASYKKALGPGESLWINDDTGEMGVLKAGVKAEKGWRKLD